MKRTISVILCLIMVLSCFASLTLVAEAADVTQYLRIAATECVNNQMTVYVYVAKGKAIKGATIFFEYDPSVVVPVTGGVEKAASSALEVHGDNVYTPNTYSVGFTGDKLIGSATAQVAVLYAKFKVINPAKLKTSIKLYCDQLLLESKDLVKRNDNASMYLMTLNFDTVPRVKDLKIANNDGVGLVLSWSAVAGADKYRIFRCEVDGNGKFLTDYVRIAEVGNTVKSYTDSGTVLNKSYRYFVLCVAGNIAGDVGSVATMKFTTALTPPAKVTVTNGAGTMVVSWPAVNGALKYRITRRVVDVKNGYYGNWVTVGDATGTSFVDSSKFEVGKRYDYSVCALRNRAYSAPSNYGSATYTNKIPAVASVAAENKADGTVRVYWKACTGVNTYDVYRCELNANGTVKTANVKIGQVSGKTEIIDSAKGLVNGATYKYSVIGVVGANVGPAGDTAKLVYKAPAPLAAPTGVAAGSYTGAVKVMWKAVPGVTTYRVYKRMVNKNNTVNEWKMIAEVNGTTYIDTSRLERGCRYDYCVVSVKGQQQSAFSATDRTTYNCNIPAVTAISAERSANKTVKISWKAVPGITKYRVYRSEIDPNTNAEKTAKVRIAEVDNLTYFVDTAKLAPGRYKYCVLCAVGENSGDVGDTAKITIS